MSEVSNFTNVSTLYSSNIELDSDVLVWFNINSLKSNPGKF